MNETEITDDFWKVNWGPDEAKNDINLENYFIELPEFKQIYKGDFRYVIGRKGSGKTAILERIIIDTRNQFNLFSQKLSLRNFPLMDFQSLKDKSLSDKSKFVPVWKFLMLIEIGKFLIEDEGAQPFEQIIEVKDFIDFNFPRGYTFIENLKLLKSKKSKIKAHAKWLGIENTKNVGYESTVIIHYSKVTEILTDKIKSITSQSTYFLLFDELDEGYNAKRTNIRLLLLSLFRAVEELYSEFQYSNLQFRPVVALRSDIFDRLEDNDLNKLDDFIIRLKWEIENHSVYSLKKLVNSRINASIRVKDPINAWDCIANNLDPELPSRIPNLWNYLFTRTMRRPRDIIKYLKCCNRLQGTGKLGYQHIEHAEIDYSNWLYREFRDEVSSFLPVWGESLQCIAINGLRRFKTQELIETFTSNELIKNYLENENKSPEYILKTLFDYSILGYVDKQGKVLFKFMDSEMDWFMADNLIVHYGFYNKLRLK